MIFCLDFFFFFYFFLCSCFVSIVCVRLGEFQLWFCVCVCVWFLLPFALFHPRLRKNKLTQAICAQCEFNCHTLFVRCDSVVIHTLYVVIYLRLPNSCVHVCAFSNSVMLRGSLEVAKHRFHNET